MPVANIDGVYGTHELFPFQVAVYLGKVEKASLANLAARQVEKQNPGPGIRQPWCEDCLKALERFTDHQRRVYRSGG